MTNTDNKQISSKQTVVLTFIISMSVKIFMLPILLLKESGRDSYLSIAIVLTLEVLCLTVMLWANKKCPDTTFYGFMQRILTKIGAKIVAAVLILYFLVKLFLILSELKIFFSVSVFDNLPWVIFVLPLLLLLFAMTRTGLNGIARTSEIFTPLILISVVVMFLLMVTNVNLSNLFPFLENGFKPITTSLLKFPLWYGDFSVFLVFLGKIKRTKHTSKSAIISAVITSVIVLAFSAMLFAAYANVTQFIQYGQNVSSLTQISLSANSLGRLDILLFTIWMISVIIKAAIVFFAVVLSIEYLFGKPKSWVAGIIVMIIIYALTAFIFPEELTFRAIAVNYLPIPALIIMYFIPLSVFLSALLRRKNTNMIAKNKRKIAKIKIGVGKGDEDAV